MFYKMYFSENEWQICLPGRVEENAFWSVPLLFACNDFIFACDEDFMCRWPLDD